MNKTDDMAGMGGEDDVDQVFHANYTIQTESIIPEISSEVGGNDLTSDAPSDTEDKNDGADPVSKEAGTSRKRRKKKKKRCVQYSGPPTKVFKKRNLSLMKTLPLPPLKPKANSLARTVGIVSVPKKATTIALQKPIINIKQIIRSSSTKTNYDVNYRSFLSVDEILWRKANNIPLEKKICSIFNYFNDCKQVLLDHGYYLVDENSKFWDVHLGFKKSIHYKLLHKYQTVNMFMNDQVFCTKISLLRAIKNAVWSSSVNYELFFPRCYEILRTDSNDGFWYDFYQSQCFSYCQHIINIDINSNIYILVDGYNKFLKFVGLLQQWIDGEYIDQNSYFNDMKTIYLSFKQPFYSLKIPNANYVDINPSHIEICTEYIKLYHEIHPGQNLLNGNKCDNIWICKPAKKSRGRGIFLSNNIDKLESLKFDKKEEWVVQKYIESPYLVFNRKFDIRQWILVTELCPLTIWFYDECYLRFCSVEYNELDYSRLYQHLSNNCIQKDQISKFSNTQLDGLMWHSSLFQSYLIERNTSDIWTDVIQPQMKDIVINTLKSTDSLIEEETCNAFQLYGFDFMIDTDYHVWLIEVNCSPDITYSTKTTETLVKEALPDLMKIVLDYPDSNNKLNDISRYPMQFRTHIIENITDQCGKWLLISKDNKCDQPVQNSFMIKGNKYKHRTYI